MNTLFLVQFACCIIVSMLGLILVLSRFQIRWTNRRYEVSRWLLAFSMFVLAWHYVLQIVCGFRAKGDEIGAVVNVLFYSPVSSFISFTISFLGYGYNMIPAEVRLELDTADEPLEVMEESEEVGLGSEKISIIESMLTSWCDKGGYRDSTVNMPMLSVKLGIPRNELSLYFENYLKSSFRIWLSDIRFKEAQRMLLEECRYSNDTISSECGFSSHAHLYKIFKAKTGFTPGKGRYHQLPSRCPHFQGICRRSSGWRPPIGLPQPRGFRCRHQAAG
jgi:AraC-like DNA-binding protein